MVEPRPPFESADTSGRDVGRDLFDTGAAADGGTPARPLEPDGVPDEGERAEESPYAGGVPGARDGEDETGPPVGVRTPGFLRPRTEGESSERPSSRPDRDSLPEGSPDGSTGTAPAREDSPPRAARSQSTGVPDEPTPAGHGTGHGAGATTVGSPAGDAAGELVQIASEVARARDGDVELAGVMARLIESADPATVERLVEAPEVHLAEVVGELLRTADPQTRRELERLLEQPEHKDVAELLQLVERDYGLKGGELPEDVREEIERRDIRRDLEITSRPGEIGWFARLDPLERRRMIVRVLCGLVAREDVPTRPLRRPRKPASPAEERLWPLSRARWPLPAPVRLPKPGAEELPRRATNASRKAS